LESRLWLEPDVELGLELPLEELMLAPEEVSDRPELDPALLDPAVE